MPLPFASFETTLNAGSLALFGNARAALVSGGAPFTVVFEEDYVSGLDVASSGPGFHCDSGIAAGLARGASVVVDRSADANAGPAPGAPVYIVAIVEPDGEGLSFVQLRKGG
jgi:hypothetical protein